MDPRSLPAPLPFSGTALPGCSPGAFLTGIRSVIEALPVDLLREITVLSDQFVIGPRLDDLAVIHHQDAVTVADGGQAVRDHDAGAFQLVQRFGHLLLRFVVQRAAVILVLLQDLAVMEEGHTLIVRPTCGSFLVRRVVKYHGMAVIVEPAEAAGGFVQFFGIQLLGFRMRLFQVAGFHVKAQRLRGPGNGFRVAAGFPGFHDVLQRFFEFLCKFLVLILGGVIGRGLWVWIRNNRSPRQTVDARIVAKRMNVSGFGHTMMGRVSAMNQMGTTTRTRYFATFETADGRRLELGVKDREYGVLAEGDCGCLSFQGTRYLGFDRA